MSSNKSKFSCSVISTLFEQISSSSTSISMPPHSFSKTSSSIVPESTAKEYVPESRSKVAPYSSSKDHESVAQSPTGSTVLPASSVKTAFGVYSEEWTYSFDSSHNFIFTFVASITSSSGQASSFSQVASRDSSILTQPSTSSRSPAP